jgi:hypothetical protein
MQKVELVVTSLLAELEFRSQLIIAREREKERERERERERWV